MKNLHYPGIPATCLLILLLVWDAALTGCRQDQFGLQNRLGRSPRVFLWVWERPEDLRFLDPHRAGVAVLAATLYLDGSKVSMRPRMQPVQLPPAVSALAVVRIETRGRSPGEGAVKEAVRRIRVLVGESAGIQIDFDALASERSFYRRLLSELRSALPHGKELSITALASWCIYDDWISGLPIDESVPMLFRMGAGDAAVKRYLGSGNDFRAATACTSVGVSLDEPGVRIPAGRRVYVFNPRPWTRESVQRALEYAREKR